MYELDRHRALADRGSDAFDRVGSHVAGREHAGAAGLEQKRLSLAGPVRGLRQRWTGSDEPLVVPLDLRRKPVGPRHRTDEAEHRRRLHRPLLPGLAVDDFDGIEVAVAVPSSCGAVRCWVSAQSAWRGNWTYACRGRRRE